MSDTAWHFLFAALIFVLLVAALAVESNAPAIIDVISRVV